MSEASAVLVSPDCMAAPIRLEPHICPACGADYEMAGTCEGFQADKHPPRKTVER